MQTLNTLYFCINHAKYYSFLFSNVFTVENKNIYNYGHEVLFQSLYTLFLWYRINRYTDLPWHQHGQRNMRFLCGHCLWRIIKKNVMIVAPIWDCFTRQRDWLTICLYCLCVRMGAKKSNVPVWFENSFLWEN